MTHATSVSTAIFLVNLDYPFYLGCLPLVAPEDRTFQDKGRGLQLDRMPFLSPNQRC